MTCLLFKLLTQEVNILFPFTNRTISPSQHQPLLDGIIIHEIPYQQARDKVEERIAQWREFLSHDALGRNRFLLVAEDDARLVGFVAGGPPRREVPGFESQLWSIYVLASHRARGLGRALFVACTRRLREAGFRSMALFTPVRNAEARLFYERLGGVVVQESRRMVGTVEMHSVAYGWRELGSL